VTAVGDFANAITQIRLSESAAVGIPALLRNPSTRMADEMEVFGQQGSESLLV
jgi:hypothetical protein